jgi:hypothetical protein
LKKTKESSRDHAPLPKDDRTLKPIPVSGRSESGAIHGGRRYRVKIDGRWYEGLFSRQWFGWQFDGYRNGIQLNLVDEVFEIVEPREAGRFRAASPPSTSET